MIYFSKSKLGFYQDELKEDYIAANNWPSDLVEITEEKYTEVYLALSNGKRLSADEDGQPIAVDRPELTPEEHMADASSKKSSMLDVATRMIAPLQDAVDLEMATSEEIKALSAWKKYRVLINRVDVSKAPEIEWPEQPQ